MHLLIGHAGEHQRQINVVLQGEVVQQVEVLKDEPEVFPPESRQPGFRNGGKVLAVQQDLPGSGLVQCGQQIQQRGFAGAAFAHDGHVFARLYRKGHAGQGRHTHPAEAGGVNFLQVVYL